MRLICWKIPPEGLAAAQVIVPVDRCLPEIKRYGAQCYRACPNRSASILSALNMLQFRRLVWYSEGIYRVVPGEAGLLTYYANAVVHWRPPANGSNDG
jgi:hypothetical protein